MEHSKHIWKEKKKKIHSREKANEAWKELVIKGKACTTFPNNAVADHIREEKHLIPWNGEDMSRLIDRFDVRNLLSTSEAFVKPKRLERNRFSTDAMVRTTTSSQVVTIEEGGRGI